MAKSQAKIRIYIEIYSDIKQRENDCFQTSQEEAKHQPFWGAGLDGAFFAFFWEICFKTCLFLSLAMAINNKMSTPVLEQYLQRIKLDINVLNLKPDLETLKLIQYHHLRNITFENLDVVCRKNISIKREDVIDKLVKHQRGGYCFEQNCLLKYALEEIGFDVEVLSCRVRYNKPHNVITNPTHIILRVLVPKASPPPPSSTILSHDEYLVDVAFSGLEYEEPLPMIDFVEHRINEQQHPYRIIPCKIDGSSRTIEEEEKEEEDGCRKLHRYRLLQFKSKDTWVDMYSYEIGCFATHAELEPANWWSCTHKTVLSFLLLRQSQVHTTQKHSPHTYKNCKDMYIYFTTIHNLCYNFLSLLFAIYISRLDL
jgi:arylamine N-acetyltransferase